ncbi:MAG: AMP-binding protein [Actinobacteria bacterium]|nr:AMP-binding protein [Actinomycetota bacterium]
MDYPWFKEYRLFGVPETLEPYPDEPTHFFLDQAAVTCPRLGCVQLGLEMSYAEVKEHADRLASALAAMGVEKGDRVATLLPTSIQFVVADAGISKAGAVHVPCSFLEPPDTLAHKFGESSPKALICLYEHLAMAEDLREHMGAPNLIITELEDYSSSPPRHGGVAGAYWLTEVIEQARPLPPAIAFEPARDLETLLFTGGTTGLPKGCMLTHRNIVANALQNIAIFGPVTRILEGNVSAILGLPFFHSYGHCIMHTMIGGLRANMLIVPDPRDTKAMVAMVKKYHPVLQFGVPTQFMKLLSEDLKGTHIIGISGSAALPPNVQEEFEKTSGGFVSEGYGLSELSPVTHFNVSTNIRIMGGRERVPLMNKLLFNRFNVAFMRAQARLLGPARYGHLFSTIIGLMTRFAGGGKKARQVEKRATIGIPLPDTVVKVVEVDSGAPLSFEELYRDGKVGEMLLQGPQRMLGYWPEPGRGLDEEGFVHTGDVVKMDENGYFSIVDRTKDMAIVSGYKVYTREVDDILYEHPATAMAATIGVPDPEREGSERIKVFVQLKEEYKGKVSEEDYLEYLRGKVAKYAVPRSVVFLDEMPLTEVFKVNKKYLREMEIGAGSEA